MIWLSTTLRTTASERAKAAAILQAWGFVRVQRSFYVGKLPRGRAANLLRVLAKHVKSGYVALIPVPEGALDGALELGKPPYAPLKPPRYKQIYVV